MKSGTVIWKKRFDREIYRQKITDYFWLTCPSLGIIIKFFLASTKSVCRTRFLLSRKYVINSFSQLYLGEPFYKFKYSSKKSCIHVFIHIEKKKVTAVVALPRIQISSMFFSRMIITMEFSSQNSFICKSDVRYTFFINHRVGKAWDWDLGQSLCNC